MESLSRKDELIMLSILNLKEDAYLVAIQNFIKTTTGKEISLTSLHIPLDKLEKRGLVESWYGEATPTRGGRRKRIFKITNPGFEVLKEHRRINDILWLNYSKSV